MKTLVLGASGATGKLVVQQLVKKNIQVRVVVRESAIIPSQISDDKSIEIIKGNINDFEIAKIKDLVKDCDSVICCLGHNLSFKGIFGPPHKLVYNTVVKIIEALQSLKPKLKVYFNEHNCIYKQKDRGSKHLRRKDSILVIKSPVTSPQR